ncbi:MAG: hypothetical protein GX230_08070, partial [Lentisphaerae bacterium]|nr:hypothetical protein [Lentisphaerota bacterium]
MHLPTLKTKTLPLLFLALLSLILVTPLNADIFRTLPTAWPAYFNAIGGNIIYSSAATVNNAAATLTLYGFDRPRSEISNFFKTRPQLTQELSRQKNTQLFIMQTAIDKSVAFIVEYHQTPPPSTPLSWPDLPQP